MSFIQILAAGAEIIKATNTRQTAALWRSPILKTGLLTSAFGSPQGRNVNLNVASCSSATPPIIPRPMYIQPQR